MARTDIRASTQSQPAASPTSIYRIYDSLDRYINFHFYSYDRSAAFANATNANTERYLGVIQLPLPNNLIDNQQIIMSETEIGPLQEYLRTADLTKLSKAGVVSALGLGVVMRSPGIVGAAVAGAAAIATTPGAQGGTDLQSYINSVPEIAPLAQAGAAAFLRGRSQQLTGIVQNLGQIINPVLTPIFNNVQLKRHNFVWRIAPESEEESKRLKQICKRLQYHSLPQEDTINISSVLPLKTLRYPDYCRVELNPEVYSFKKNCFIENVIINYAPEGVNAFYKDGSPIVTEISVFLIEANIYTKSDFDSEEIGSLSNDPDTVEYTQLSPVDEGS